MVAETCELSKHYGMSSKISEEDTRITEEISYIELLVSDGLTYPSSISNDTNGVSLVPEEVTTASTLPSSDGNANIYRRNIF